MNNKKPILVMRIIIFIFVFSIGSFLQAQTEVSNPLYNKALADSLGADNYGMKLYTLVILRTGPVKIEDQEKLNTLFRGHLDNIFRLEAEGKLVVAGPFGNNANSFRGMYIFDVPTVQEAKVLLKSDPAIEAGIFDVDMYQWYGSAALKSYLNVHKLIEKAKP